MRLTTKGRFAVTAMIDLALRQDKGPVTLSAISQRQEISLSYLEQLFGKLRRHEIDHHGWLPARCTDLFPLVQNADGNRQSRTCSSPGAEQSGHYGRSISHRAVESRSKEIV